MKNKSFLRKNFVRIATLHTFVAENVRMALLFP